MRRTRKRGVALLLAGLAWAVALQAGATGVGEAGIREAGAAMAIDAGEGVAAVPVEPGADAAETRGEGKATLLELMDEVCRKRRRSQYNVCVEHCESQGMWGWYDDPGTTCGYGARCTCVYYAEVLPGK